MKVSFNLSMGVCVCDSATGRVRADLLLIKIKFHRLNMEIFYIVLVLVGLGHFH